ncbi:ATP-dependent DNA ligase [Cohnella soli]|uniref:ATP-dependent DNA ligase n=1 Tax=Cohnella soli TaxID=425005 RepID=A0ABW0HRT1_9BACL
MFFEPMLLEKRESPFDDERFLYEPKIDGHRNILSMDGKVRLFTRHHNDVTSQYPELHDVPIDDTTDLVLDGEVACLDQETGTIDFGLIQQRSKMQKDIAIRQAMIQQPVHYYVFDILRYRGRDLRALPLTERKQILQQVLKPNQYFSNVMSVPGTGIALFDVIREKQLEGIVAKRKTSKYVGRRSSSWIKIINYAYDIVQISGYRKNQFGWLLSKHGRYVGFLEYSTLVPENHRRAFYSKAQGLITREDQDFVFLDPRINARVRFRNWTRAGMLRTPEFVDFVV